MTHLPTDFSEKFLEIYTYAIQLFKDEECHISPIKYLHTIIYNLEYAIGAPALNLV